MKRTITFIATLILIFGITSIKPSNADSIPCIYFPCLFPPIEVPHFDDETPYNCPDGEGGFIDPLDLGGFVRIRLKNCFRDCGNGNGANRPGNGNCEDRCRSQHCPNVNNPPNFCRGSNCSSPGTAS